MSKPIFNAWVDSSDFGRDKLLYVTVDNTHFIHPHESGTMIADTIKRPLLRWNPTLFDARQFLEELMIAVVDDRQKDERLRLTMPDVR
jgi:hypothetical protein